MESKQDGELKEYNLHYKNERWIYLERGNPPRDEESKIYILHYKKEKSVDFLIQRPWRGGLLNKMSQKEIRTIKLVDVEFYNTPTSWK